MNNQNPYHRKETKNKLFHVLGPDNKIIKSHLEENFPELSDNISENLIADLNGINAYNKLNNPGYNQFPEEMIQSFFYCVLSTMMACKKNKRGIEINIDYHINGDRLSQFYLEYNNQSFINTATKKVRQFFDHQSVASIIKNDKSLKDKVSNDVIVTSENIQIVKSLLDEMSIHEKVMIEVLHQFFDQFSIIIQILWVAGKIGDEDVVASYWALYHQEDLYELNEEEYEYPRFLMNRLLFLKTLRYGYMWNDATLPN